MWPLLTVDLPADPAAREANQAILAACDEALRPRHCESRVSAQLAPIRVRWSAADRAEIDDFDGRRWRHQTLAFSEADASVERWRAVGLLVAAIGSEAAGRDAAESQPSTSAPRASAERARVELDLNALAMLGPGASRSAWRGGALVSAGVRARSSPLGFRLALNASRGGTNDAAVSATWLSAAAGPYAAVDLGRGARFSLGLDAGWEWLIATVSESTAASDTRGYLSVRPWAAGAFQVSSWLGLLAGVEVPLTPGHAIRLDGREVGQNPPLGLLALVGFEIRPLR